MTWILLIIIAILILLLFDHKSKTKLITKKLRDILYENSRERIKFNNLNRENKDLIKNINILLDRYQLISVDNKNYKEQHRKMISNISHDIRTPLTALMGYIELVKDDSISKEKREEYFDIIDERGNALRDLMEEFFQMAKIESKDMDINIEEVNISEVIRQNILTFMNDINKKEIIPKINIGEEEVFVLGDKKWIHRAIENVISNSLRYGYEGKVLGIDLEEGKNSVKLTIWDKGRGIEKDQIPYIFDRLYTTDKSRNRKHQGSGLGLSITKKLIENMNGKITVSSIPYEKTSFTIILPKK